METIRNYLESMFANLPNTPEVLRAKSELWQMMEDKYNELVSEGMQPGEAVGVVIADFGNLDELADSLGIQNVMQMQLPYQGRVLPEDEVQRYLDASEKSTRLTGIGVMLCIISPIPFLIAGAMTDNIGLSEGIILGVSTAFFFLLLAAAISIFVYNSVRMGSWKYLKRESVCIDYATAEYLHANREKERPGQALTRTIGVLLCAFCFVPVAVMGALGANDTVMMIGAILLFLFVGTGVLLLILAGGREDAYRMLLRTNNRQTVSGNYVPSQQEVSYSSKTVETIMSVYRPTVLCIYLIWSFLSFDWYITWIIWPIAAILRSIINSIWGGGKEQKA